MREIKFRAWDKELNRMCDVIQLGVRDIIVNSIEEDEISGFLPIDRFEIMQYTGLKDKNGKEIFEGDILLYLRKSKRIVSYKNGAFIRYYGNYNEYLLYDSFIEDGYLTDYEVIGNIYENPELLEGNQYESITDNK